MKKIMAVVVLGISTFALAQTTEFINADGSRSVVKTDKNGTLVTTYVGADQVLTATRETDHDKAVKAAKAAGSQSTPKTTKSSTANR
jgi:hypothetical protein